MFCETDVSVFFSSLKFCVCLFYDFEINLVSGCRRSSSNSSKYLNDRHSGNRSNGTTLFEIVFYVQRARRDMTICYKYLLKKIRLKFVLCIFFSPNKHVVLIFLIFFFIYNAQTKSTKLIFQSII